MAQWTKTGASGFEQTDMSGAGLPFTYWAAAAMGDARDRVYIAGSGGAPWSAELDRLLANGSFDTGFGSGGKVSVADTGQPPAYTYTLAAVALQSDGRIVVAGSRQDLTGTWPALVRFWP